MGTAKKGSMTIFAALSLMLVSAVLFSLLEACRYHELKLTARLRTESVLESVFANYEAAMWETYHLLVLDDGRTDEQGAFAVWEWYAAQLAAEDASLWGAVNHLRMKPEQITFEKYRLITDDDGKVFMAAVSSYMKSHIAGNVLERLTEEHQTFASLGASDSVDPSAIESADEAIEAAKEEALQEEDGEASEDEPEEELPEEVAELEESPLEVIKGLWSTGILKLVLEDTKSVSKAKESMKDAVSKRTLATGTFETAVRTTVTDSVLLSQYLLQQFACYTEGEAAGTLQYELEYLLCGNEKDEENLCGAAERLLAVREAANLVYLATDAEKQNLAYSVALALAGISANPAIIHAVKYGILAAWALAESILDVRALLAGDKIALIKKKSQWTSDLLHLGSAFADSGKAINCSNGLGYKGYLGFLLTVNEKRSCYRAMDLQEAAIRHMEGHEDFYMDHMATEAVMSADYRVRTIFTGTDGLTNRWKHTRTISSQTAFSYIRKN